MRSSANKAAVLIAACAVLIAAGCGGAEDDEPIPATATPSTIVERLNALPYEGLPVEGTFIGDADAPVLIEMYEDFGCPHCLDFTADFEPHLLENYVARGEVRLQYRFFPLRQLTANAAIAAYCASEQDLFWPFHTELFIAQARATDGTGRPLTEAFEIEVLRELAETLELDLDAFDTCTTSDRVIEVITEDLRTATDLNLPGTPSFLINGEVLRNVPDTREGWSAVIDPLIGE
jgi:protein-disulfide isomerase